MKKQILSEEFSRMQKLAGIEFIGVDPITESNINISNDYKIKSSILFQIANKLKDSKYLGHIIKELKQFFNDIIDD